MKQNRKDLLAMYLCGFLVTCVYLFCPGGHIESDLDFVLWIVPGLFMMFLPVVFFRVKQIYERC